MPHNSTSDDHFLHAADGEGSICAVPVVHGKLEFAQEVQRRFFDVQPEAIAVEFPKTLEIPIMRAVRRLPFLSVVLYQEKDGTTVYLLIEPTDGLIEAVRLGIEHQNPVFFVDRDTEGYPRIQEALPDSYSIARIGYQAYCDACWQADARFSRPETPEDELREATMVYHLQQLRTRYASILFVCGLAHHQRVFALLDESQAQPLGRAKREGVQIANVHADSSREILSEMPALAAEYERRRATRQPLDRLAAQADVVQQARAQHLVNNQEKISVQQLAMLYKFARNYALIQHQLAPNFYHLVAAARGAVNDNYAYEVWDVGSAYPWQDPNPKFATIALRGEDLYLNQKKIRFHRTFRTLRKQLRPMPVRTRKREHRPEEWKDRWEGQQICSYPPEDVLIEGYGRYMQKKTTQILAEEQHRAVPFSASLLDGLDLRETIRNWHEHKLYVLERLPVKGKVGSVVLIFDEDPPDTQQREAYPWRVTWLGEHADESDLAFYATPAGEQLVGPGISRCVYGGVMLTYPPMRVYDIWKDAFFTMARSKPERLLLAAIDYSEERLIAYVAAKPPRSWCYTFAEKVRKKVVYIPIGQFSPVMLRKLQVFHVLDGYNVREYAKMYLG